MRVQTRQSLMNQIQSYKTLKIFLATPASLLILRFQVKSVLIQSRTSRLCLKIFILMPSHNLQSNLVNLLGQLPNLDQIIIKCSMANNNLFSCYSFIFLTSIHGERRGEREGCTTAFIFLQFESERGAVLKLEVQTKASFK